MGDIRITDLVAPKAFEQLKELQAELTNTKETFLSVIKELGDVVKGDMHQHHTDDGSEHVEPSV